MRLRQPCHRITTAKRCPAWFRDWVWRENWFCPHETDKFQVTTGQRGGSEKCQNQSGLLAGWYEAFCVGTWHNLHVYSPVHLPTIPRLSHPTYGPAGLQQRLSSGAGDERRKTGDTIGEIQPVIVRCHESWQVSGVGRASVYQPLTAELSDKCFIRWLGPSIRRRSGRYWGRDLNCH